MGWKMRAPLEPFNTVVIDGFMRGGPQLLPMMPRYASLSDSCTPDGFSFPVELYLADT